MKAITSMDILCLEKCLLNEMLAFILARIPEASKNWTLEYRRIFEGKKDYK